MHRLLANKRTKQENIDYFHKFERHSLQSATVLMKCLLLSNSELKWVKTDNVSKQVSLIRQVDFLSLDNSLSVYREKSWDTYNRIDSDEGARSSEMYNSFILLHCCLFPNFSLEKLQNNYLRMRNRLYYAN